MKTLDVLQGTPEWLALKENYDSASEASVMMGCSKVMSRDDLLKYKATGQEREVSKYTEEVIFPNGHRVEALARPFAEEFIGEKLYPVVGSSDDDSLLASFDGLTMSEEICWECKQWNEEKADIVRDGSVPIVDAWQVIQALVVSRAEKCLYTISDGTKERTVHTWRSLVGDAEKQLLAGWKQFNEDRAHYVYTPEPELIKAEFVPSLPAVSIKVDGAIALIDNLGVFGEALEKYIDGTNKKPETDQDFANLESSVKTLKKAEEALSAAENGALAQATSIDAMRRTVDLYRNMARDNRLIIEKLVKSQKGVLKNKIVTDARTKIDEHIANLNAGLGANYLNNSSANFISALKGKRTITSLHSAANNELARAKIETNELAEIIRANLKALKARAAEYKFLFNDLASIIGKENSDFVLLMNDRISGHKQEEAGRLDREREKIRQEEEAKAKVAAGKEAVAERERIRAEEVARIEQENKGKAEADAKEERDRVETQRLQDVMPAPNVGKPAGNVTDINKTIPRKAELIDKLELIKAAARCEVSMDVIDINMDTLNVLVNKTDKFIPGVKSQESTGISASA